MSLFQNSQQERKPKKLELSLGVSAKPQVIRFTLTTTYVPYTRKPEKTDS